MRHRHLFLPLLVFGLLLVNPALAQDATAEAPQDQSIRFSEIRDNPARFENQQVEIEGMVDRYVDSQSAVAQGSAQFFYLKDHYGDALLVRTTAEMPDLRVLYQISGTVTWDARGQLYVDEDTRRAMPMSEVEGFARSSTVDPTVAEEAIGGTPGGNVPPPPVQPENSPGLPNWMIGLFALTGALVVALIYFAVRPSPKPAAVSSLGSQSAQGSQPSPAASAPAASAPAAAGPASGASLPEPSSVIEDKTVKFYAPPPGTIKVLGGRFEVEKPERNTIRFFSVPGSNGTTEITFGRKPGKPYTHIQLKEQTVSSEHAKVRIVDGEYEIVNLSKTNPTRLNGEEVSDAPTGLKDGDTVEMGEVSFVFKTE